MLRVRGLATVICPACKTELQASKWVNFAAAVAAIMVALFVEDKMQRMAGFAWSLVAACAVAAALGYLLVACIGWASAGHLERRQRAGLDPGSR